MNRVGIFLRQVTLPVTAILTVSSLLGACSNASLTNLAPNVGENRPVRGAAIDAKVLKGTLLYVSDPGTKTVEVYAFPKGRHVATLTGFVDPMGECVDVSGNIYVVDEGA